MATYHYVLFIAFFVMCMTTVKAYFIAIDAHAEECFHDRVSSGTRMALTFEVAEGGFLDIDVKVNMKNLFSLLFPRGLSIYLHSSFFFLRFDFVSLFLCLIELLLI